MSHGSNADTVSEAPETNATTPRGRRCWYYKSRKGCINGELCPHAHSEPAKSAAGGSTTTKKKARDPAPDVPSNGSHNTLGPTWDVEEETKFDDVGTPKYIPTYASPGEDWYKESWFMPSAVQDEPYTPSAIRHPSTPKVTIYSEDKEQKWILNSERISKLSNSFAAVFAYLPGGWDKDPCKTVPGIRRVLHGNNQFQLDDVTADEFDIFLSALKESSVEEFSYEDLKIILGLSSDWGFEGLRDRSKDSPERAYLDPLDKVTLGRRCRFPEWVSETYLYLVLRMAPPSDYDAEILGATATAIIRGAREEISTHRQQFLSSEELLVWGSGCARRNCKEAVTEAWLGVRGGRVVGDSSVDTAIVGQILADTRRSGKTLCSVCRTETGVKNWLQDMEEEYELARAILTYSLGTEDSKWLEPAQSGWGEPVQADWGEPAQSDWGKPVQLGWGEQAQSDWDVSWS